MPRILSKSFVIFLMTLAGSAVCFAQSASVKIEQKRQAEGISSWWFVLIFVLAVALAVIVFEFFKRKKAARESARKSARRRISSNYDMISIDAEREMNWAKKRADKKPPKFAVKKVSKPKIEAKPVEIEEPLPIFGIKNIEPACAFEPLPVSGDEFLLEAAEQVREEFDGDAQAREIALKILAAFKTKNSVEAISQVALYDFSSFLRSRAISVLADFDHESVFECVLLACADPSREVRAAAARALFRLSFERKQAWLRISELEDTGRMRQCALALTAGDLVERSLERLTHRDRNYAAEAFAITVLLIKAGETEAIFAFLKNHSDSNLQKAILHVLKIADVPDALEQLFEIREDLAVSDEIRAEIETILENSEVLMLCK